MKYIIIGLGNFGGPLATELTQLGHEVIGVDNSMEKINAYKDSITIGMNIDATSEIALGNLPLDDCEAIIVAIGEDFKASIHVTALLKQLTSDVKIISRVFSPLQKAVIEAIRVDEIIHPELEAAQRYAKSLSMENVEASHQLDDDISVVELKLESYWEGELLEKIMALNPEVRIIAIKQKRVKQTLIKTSSEYYDTVLRVNPGIKLSASDLIVAVGALIEVQKFAKLLLKHP
jgi:trk system potassium uptake protein TrkA